MQLPDKYIQWSVVRGRTASQFATAAIAEVAVEDTVFLDVGEPVVSSVTGPL